MSEIMKWVGISGSWKATSPEIARDVRKTAREIISAGNGIITKEQAENLIAQLTTLQEQNPDGLIENPNNTAVDTTTYYGRNQQVVNVSDELIAFQANESKGTQDAIDRAKAKGIPVKIYCYKVK